MPKFKLPSNVLDLLHSKVEKRPSDKDSNFNYIHQEDVFLIAELAFSEGYSRASDNLEEKQNDQPTKQGSEPLQEIAALVKCYDECKDYDGFYLECGEIVDRMRQLLPC